MPLFSRHSEPVEEPPRAVETHEQAPKRHGIFGSRHSQEVAPAPAPQPVQEERGKRHGLFGSRRSPSPSPSSSTRNTVSTSRTSPDRSGGVFRRSTDASKGSILHRSFSNGNAEVDPSIVAARERVMSAETAEREADRALMAARESVREARDHVRRLELEAEEEARRAKIKQYQAREVSKRGKQLGRKSLLGIEYPQRALTLLQVTESKVALTYLHLLFRLSCSSASPVDIPASWLTALWRSPGNKCVITFRIVPIVIIDWQDFDILGV